MRFSNFGSALPSKVKFRLIEESCASFDLAFQLIFVWVWALVNVPLIDGFWGSWRPCFPQYLTIAILDGLFHSTESGIISLDSRTKSFPKNPFDCIDVAIQIWGNELFKFLLKGTNYNWFGIIGNRSCWYFWIKLSTSCDTSKSWRTISIISSLPSI